MTPHFSVCIDAVLESQPLPAALKTVAECGYSAFEFWCWWEKDMALLSCLCEELDLQVAACCTKFVSLVDESVRGFYLQGLQQSIGAAHALKCPVLISQVGDFLPHIPRQNQHDCLVEGLRDAAKLLAGSDIILAIEPLNAQVDHPGYYLVQSQEAFDIVRSVDSPNVKVTYDIYHQQISEGHLIDTIVKNIEHIAHFHAAGNPGRHELARGEINYPEVFSAIAKTGYNGHIGLEYWPLDDPSQGLKQVRSWF